MQLAHKVYFSDTLDMDKNISLKKILKKKEYKELYLICYNPNNKNPLEIYQRSNLNRIIIDDNDYYVVGLASSEEDAFELIRIIVDDVYKLFGNIDQLSNLFNGD